MYIMNSLHIEVFQIACICIIKKYTCLFPQRALAVGCPLRRSDWSITSEYICCVCVQKTKINNHHESVKLCVSFQTP